MVPGMMVPKVYIDCVWNEGAECKDGAQCSGSDGA